MAAVGRASLGVVATPGSMAAIARCFRIERRRTDSRWRSDPRRLADRLARRRSGEAQVAIGGWCPERVRLAELGEVHRSPPETSPSSPRAWKEATLKSTLGSPTAKASSFLSRPIAAYRAPMLRHRCALVFFIPEPARNWSLTADGSKARPRGRNWEGWTMDNAFQWG